MRDACVSWYTRRGLSVYYIYRVDTGRGSAGWPWHKSDNKHTWTISMEVAIIVAKKPRVGREVLYSRKIINRISQRLKRGFETRSVPSLRRKRNANIPTKLRIWTTERGGFSNFRTRSINKAVILYYCRVNLYRLL